MGHEVHSLPQPGESLRSEEWMVYFMENPISMDDGNRILGNHHIWICIWIDSVDRFYGLVMRDSDTTPKTDGKNHLQDNHVQASCGFTKFFQPF